MAAGNTGGWVSRVGASGGGRAYRRRRPINFYGVLGVIVVLGVASVAYARHTYLSKPAPPPPPRIGTNWFAALGLDACGEELPALAPNPSSSISGFEAIKGGAIWIHPMASDQEGDNATLARFVEAYPGLRVDPYGLSVPGKPAVSYATGSNCAKGTHYAGEPGRVVIATWPNVDSTSPPTLYTDPAHVRFTNKMLITIAFLPKGTTPSKPPSSAIDAMYLGPKTTSTTTTTTPKSSSTSSTTTTTKPTH